MQLNTNPKRQLRQQAAAWRDSLNIEWRETHSAAAWQVFFALPEVLAAQTIMLYASFRSELSTMAAMRYVLSINKRLVLPRVIPNSRQLQACLINSLAQLQVGAYGIPEPKDDAPIVDAYAIDIVAVPGLAFDRTGYRLGYGAGYYDRFLPQLHKSALAIGICFSGQLVTRVPRQPNDVRLPCLVTEDALIRQPRHMAPDRSYACYLLDSGLQISPVITTLQKQTLVVFIPNAASDQASMQAFIYNQLDINQVSAADCLVISDHSGPALAAGLAIGAETLLITETSSPMHLQPHFILSAWKEWVLA